MLVLALTLAGPCAAAQELAEDMELAPVLSPPTALSATVAVDSPWQESFRRSEKVNPALVRQRTWGLIAAYTLAFGLYGKNKWWNEGFSSTFESADEGWFGRDTYAGGADKLGHFYSTYTSTRLISRAFEQVGNSPGDALKLAAWTTAATFTAIEVLDGFSKQWHFSKEDAIMNLAGVGAGILLEKHPALDRLIDLRLLYRPSAEAQGFEPFGDYAGQTYLIVAKANGVPAWQTHPVLRYLEFAVGYNARGFSETPGSATANGSRGLYVGISLNLAELLGVTVFKRKDAHQTARRATNMFLEFVQVPGTAALVRHEF